MRSVNGPAGTRSASSTFARDKRKEQSVRGLLLWLVGIPIPVILVLWLTGLLG